jgi:hypothetical protein
VFSLYHARRALREALQAATYSGLAQGPFPIERRGPYYR